MRTAHTVPAAPFAHALAALMGLLPACATVSANAPAATATTVESPARDRGTATSMGATIRPDWIDTPGRRFPAQRFLTGVGSGIVIDGKLFEGNRSAGAELGHSVIVADGEKKAEAIRDMICGGVTTAVPASLLQLHPDVTVVCDKKAYSLVK